MILRDMVLEEHSKAQCKKIVEYIGSDKRKFTQLMNLLRGKDRRLSQRSAWPMSYLAENHPELIMPYIGELIENLSNAEQHDAIVRNTVRILQSIEIPEEHHGKLMSTCFHFIESNNVAAAIKAFSLTILDNLSRLYPEIRPELKLIIEERWAHESAAFRSRGKKILGR